MKRAATVTAAILTAVALPSLAQQGNPGENFLYSWDVNEDGYVTLEEARDRRDAVFAAFDANEDGILSNEEYAVLDQARDHQPGQGQGQGLGQGQGAGQGMGKGQGRMGQGRGMGQGQGMGAGIQAGFAMDADQVDQNGDGTVTREEFINSVDAWFATKDQDGDGRLSQADFTRRN